MQQDSQESFREVAGCWQDDYSWRTVGSWSGVEAGWNSWASQEGNVWWATPSQNEGYSWGGANQSDFSHVEPNSFISEDDHTARVHFGKTYQVLAEILESHPAAFQQVGSFVDLGCAPGGFSCRLLEHQPKARGLGVTMPHEAGGFPMLLEDERFSLQACDLMTLREPQDLAFDMPLVDVCMADAQDLGRRTNKTAENNRSSARGRGKAAKAAAAKEAWNRENAGVQACLSVLGIWALTLQEIHLGLGRLAAGGTFVFRFGWRGRGANEELWYREATHLLLALIMMHFSETVAFKSEFSHQADASFYIVASAFHRDGFISAGLGAKLREAIDNVVACRKVAELPVCMEALTPYLTDDVRPRIEEMLDEVGRKRAIGLASRHHVEAAARSSPDAALYISPVPFSLTMQRIRERLERCGRITKLQRRSHPVGVGADALIQFAQPAHATAALEAINSQKILGPSVAAKRCSEMQK